MARTVGSSGEKTRQLLDRMALELMARRGFEAVSMRDLAKAVGVGAPALYRYYRTKQDVLDGLITAHLDALDAATDAALGGLGANSREMLNAFVANHLEFHLHNPLSTQVANLELRSLDRERLSRIVKRRTAYERRLRDILRQGAEAQVFRLQDPALTASAILQMLTGAVVWLRPDQRLATAEVVARYQAMTARLVGLKGE